MINRPLPTIPERIEDPTDQATRQHLPKDRVQALAIQSALCDIFIDFHLAFRATRELPLKHGIAETMQGLARSWREVVATRREILGKPRVGSLSPAERAAMRQRKANRDSARRSGPTVAKKVAPVVAPPAEPLPPAA